MNTEQKAVTGGGFAPRIPHAKWYAGYNREGYILFRSRIEPTEQTHPAFSFCFGPYKTQREAREVAQYQSYGRLPEGATELGGLLYKTGSIL